MNFYNKALALILTVVMAMMASVSVAQDINESNLTGSPYSRYGYGKLGSLGNAVTRGMGEVGIALRNSNYTNIANPASLTSIDTLTMIFSMGLDASFVNYNENAKSEHEWNGGFSYMSFHFPLWRNFAMSLSLTPYTSVGYYYGGSEKIPVQSPINKHDTLGIISAYSGVGGINNFMLGLGYSPIKTKMSELSVGLNAGFLFGSINHSSALTTTTQGNSTVATQSMHTKGLLLKFGAQYTYRLNATRSMVVGATFQPGFNLSVDTEDLEISTDTLTYTEQIRHGAKTPMQFGVGFTYSMGRELTVTAEYEFAQWSKVKGFQTDLLLASDVFTDTHRFAVGAEYIPQPGVNRFWKNCRYRLGANTQNLYMLMNKVKLRDYNVTAGISLPVNRRCFLDFSAGYERIQPSRHNLLKENYLNFSVGVTFNEMMFFRNKLR